MFSVGDGLARDSFEPNRSRSSKVITDPEHKLEGMSIDDSAGGVLLHG
jgi:hypothetical protein